MHLYALLIVCALDILQVEYGGAELSLSTISSLFCYA